MFALDARIAQQIVARTMQIIPFNVNVMDARGVIIGSGEAERLGSVHAAAQLAIAQGRTVEVDAEATRYLAGARPGVNLLLTVRGQLCGVVGLSGEPEAVRQFGELVRMTAEMILEQNLLNRDLQRDVRYREEFVLQLIDADQVGSAELQRWASRLEIDLTRPRVAMLLRLDAALSPDAALAEIQHCQQRLAAVHPDYLSAAQSATSLVVLLPLADVQPDSARAALESLHAWFKRECSAAFQLAMGMIFTTAEGAAPSWQSAQATLKIAATRKLRSTQLSYYDLRLPVLLSTLGSGWRAEQLHAPLQRLDAADRRQGLLRSTLQAWFAANGNLALTAQRLHIHRNTLDYRLRQIGEITGLDLARVDDRFLLYVALQLE